MVACQNSGMDYKACVQMEWNRGASHFPALEASCNHASGKLESMVPTASEKILRRGEDGLEMGH